jgi:hypothetical protein
MDSGLETLGLRQMVSPRNAEYLRATCLVGLRREASLVDLPGMMS